LAEELAKHGVPSNVAEARWSQAIKAIGSEQLVQALQQKQPWHQLKTFGQQCEFQVPPAYTKFQGCHNQ
jgi:hypothetical protein